MFRSKWVKVRGSQKSKYDQCTLRSSVGASTPKIWVQDQGLHICYWIQVSRWNFKKMWSVRYLKRPMVWNMRPHLAKTLPHCDSPWWSLHLRDWWSWFNEWDTTWVDWKTWWLRWASKIKVGTSSYCKQRQCMVTTRHLGILCSQWLWNPYFWWWLWLD